MSLWSFIRPPLTLPRSREVTKATEKCGLIRFHQLGGFASEQLSPRFAKGRVSVTVSPGWIPFIMTKLTNMPSKSFSNGILQQKIENLAASPIHSFSSSNQEEGRTASYAPAEAWTRIFFDEGGRKVAEMNTIQSLQGWNAENTLVESTPLVRWPLLIAVNVHMHTEAVEKENDEEVYAVKMNETLFSVSVGSGRARFQINLAGFLHPRVAGKSFVKMDSVERGLWYFDVKLLKPDWMSKVPSNKTGDHSPEDILIRYQGEFKLDEEK